MRGHGIPRRLRGAGYSRGLSSVSAPKTKQGCTEKYDDVPVDMACWRLEETLVIRRYGRVAQRSGSITWRTIDRDHLSAETLFLWQTLGFRFQGNWMYCWVSQWHPSIDRVTA